MRSAKIALNKSLNAHSSLNYRHKISRVWTNAFELTSCINKLFVHRARDDWVGQLS